MYKATQENYFPVQTARSQGQRLLVNLNEHLCDAEGKLPTVLQDSFSQLKPTQAEGTKVKELICPNSPHLKKILKLIFKMFLFS